MSSSIDLPPKKNDMQEFPSHPILRNANPKSEREHAKPHACANQWCCFSNFQNFVIESALVVGVVSAFVAADIVAVDVFGGPLDSARQSIRRFEKKA